MSIIGYIRVSTEQQEIMSTYHTNRIFSEKILDRPQLKAMLDHVREGDMLYVERDLNIDF